MSAKKKKEERIELGTGNVAKIVIRRHLKKDSETVEGRLVDLSTGGAKVAVARSLKFSEAIGLRILVPEMELEIDVAAQVCWMRSATGDQWVVGCSFTPKISDELVVQLAQRGYVERRRDRRHEIALPANACWQLEKGRIPVEVRDCSTGGFCIATEKAGDIGTQIQVTLSGQEEPRVITGRIQWQVKVHDKILIGCAYSLADDFAYLRKAVDRHKLQLQKK